MDYVLDLITKAIITFIIFVVLVCSILAFFLGYWVGK